MSVKARGNSWQATVSHQGKRYRRDFPTKQEAEQWELDTKAALKRGVAPVIEAEGGTDPKPVTMQALYDLTCRRYWNGSKGARTALLNGKECVRLLGPGLHPQRVDVTRIDQLIFEWRAAGNVNGTINRKLAAISKMMRVACDRDVITKKPKIERLKEAEHRIRFFSEEEERDMLNFFARISADDMREFCTVDLDTGLRVGELLAATDRDLGDKSLSVWMSKSGRPRTIPLTPRSKTILMARAKARGKLFPTLTQSTVTHYWNRMRSALGMTDDAQFVPHCMRHTFCSRLAQRGANAKTIQELAGHSSMAVTQRYMHLKNETLEAAISLLSVVPQAEADKAAA